jgi:hypothetical protein
MREIFRLVGKIALDGTVELDEKLKAIDKQAGKVGASLNKMGKDLTKIGMEFTKNVTVPIAAAGVAIYKGIELASDLSETIAKTGEIFGDGVVQLEEWAGKAAESMGQSKQQALDAASTFGIFGKSAGLAGQDLVNFSTQFTGLASDLASFNNTTPEEAIIALGAAMRGENEPIRRYGVLLDDASLRAKALEMGIVSTTKNALTPQQKVLAASALIWDQTATAQNDFARTSNQLANQQRILKAEINNMATEMGSAFLPVAQTVVGILRDNFLPVVKGLVDWFKNLSPEMRDSVVILAAMAAAFGPILMLVEKLSSTFGVLIPLIGKLITGQLSLNAAMAANPALVIVSALTALVAVGVLVWKNWDAIKEFGLKAWDTITYGVQQAISFMKTLFLSWVKMQVDSINMIGKYIPGLNTLLDSARKTLDGWIESEKNAIQYRKQARAESLEEAKALKEQEQALKDSKAAVDDLNESKREQIKVTAEQLEAQRIANEQTEAWRIKLLEQQALDDENQAARDELQRLKMEADLKAVGDNEAAKQMIREYYQNAQTESQKKAYDAQATTFQNYIDQISEGEKTLKDVIKEMVIKQLDALQHSALAELIKGIATAWAQAPATFGASLSWIPPLVAQKGLAIAGIQAAKGLIRGLAEGGTTTSPGFVMVGEEGPELLNLPKGATVTPLDHPNAGAAMGGYRTAQINLYMDRRLIGQTAVEYLQDTLPVKAGVRI